MSRSETLLKNKKPLYNRGFLFGVTGFEPATTRPPVVCATWLRYTPALLLIIHDFFWRIKSIVFFYYVLLGLDKLCLIIDPQPLSVKAEGINHKGLKNIKHRVHQLQLYTFLI
jgi:hypothetical protein